MSDNELIKELNNLRVNDDGIDALDGDYSEDQKIQLQEKLQDTNSNEFQTLAQQLIENPTQVLLFLKLLDDKSGSILVKLINHGDDSYQSLAMNVLSTIRGILIKSSDVREYFLKVYITIVTRFKVTNVQHLNLFLTFVGDNKDINNAVLVILVHDLDLHKKESTETVKDYLQLHVDEQALDGTTLRNFISTLDMCFPVLPEICSAVYTNSSTKKHILDAFSNHSKDQATIISVLKLIAASSIVETCRTFTIEEYFTRLLDYLQSSYVRIRILAALSVVKLWTFIETQQKSKVQVTNLARDLLLYIVEGDDFEYVQYSLEGLVYLSLFWKVRDLIRMDVSLIERLIQLLLDFSSKQMINTSVQYGILSILSNITKLKQPEFNSTAKKLKNVTTPQVESEHTEENQDNIKLFNKQLVEQFQIISKLSAIKTYQSSSDNSFNEVITIIYHLSTDQTKSIRVELVKQGALVLIMNFLVNTSTIEKTGNRVFAVPSAKGEKTIEQRVKALRSLARMLICVDPRVSFQKYDVKSAIPFLVELLGPVTSEPITSKQSYLQQMTSLDSYESLLALTNIAAADDPDTRKLLVAQIVPYIDELIVLKDQTQIASFELLNNLISEPILLAKFFNVEQSANKQRLEIVVKLLNSDNLRLQVVIAGFLVNATNIDMIADVIAESMTLFDELLETIIVIMQDQVQDADLIEPISFLLVNSMYALANKNESQLEHVKSEKLKSACLLALRNGTAQSKEAIASVCSLLDF